MKTQRTYLLKGTSALAGAAILMGLTAGVRAQQSDQAAADEEVFDQIIVTGSFIRRSGFEGPSPLQVLDASTISAQAATNLTDIVKNIAVNTGSEFNFDRTNQNFTFGTAQFNIRGLGLGSTLTLVNGRRQTRSAAVANDGSQFVDVNTLPMNMIERIEILKDGASALYGSDAVAGVVNIITRESFEGFELEGQYQTVTQGSQADYNLNAAFGAVGEKSSAQIFFTYFERTELDGVARDFFPRLGDVETNTGQGIPGTFFPAIPDGMGGFRQPPGPPGFPAGSLNLPPPSRATGTGPVPDPRCLDVSGLGRDNASFVLLGPGGGTRAGINPGDDVSVLGPNVRGFCSFNFGPFFSLVPDERRMNVFAQGKHEVSDNFEFFGEVSYSDNRSTVDASPSLPNRTLPLLIPANNPFIPTVADLGGVNNPVFHNADGTPRAVFVQFRVNSGVDGPGFQQVEKNMWRALGGFRFFVGDSWSGEVAYQYSRSRSNFTALGTLLVETQAALNGELAGFEGQFLNPFASSIVGQRNDPGLVEAVLGTKRRQSTSALTTIDAHMTGDLPIELEGGNVGVAFGATYRKNEFDQDNSDGVENGSFFFDPPSPDGSGELDVFGFFGEVNFPIFDNLELAGAIRFEDYGGATGSTTDPKISARWQATDWLGTRASWGTSFRAPSVTQTEIDEQSAQRLQDPFFPGPGGLSCDANANGLIDPGESRPVNSGFSKKANPNLKPENSTNLNLGVVVDPGNGFRMSVDYWRYNYKNVIVLEDPQALLFNDCLDDGMPTTNQLLIMRTGGALVNVKRDFFNAGSIKTAGLDFALSYGLDLGDWGSADATANISWTRRFDINLGGLGAGTFSAGTIDGLGSRNRTNPFRSVPALRINVPVNWNYQNHTLNVTYRYIHGVTDDASGFRVSSYTTYDLQYRYVFEELFGEESVTSLVIGVVNLFNNKVPKIPGETFGFDSKLHDPRERMVYARLKQNF